MPSLLPGYEYDIFISYRQNDNRSGWVTEFVKALQEELSSTIKEPVSVYFDSDLHDGLLETHNVDKSLEGKLKCLIFIPIISQTYCDTKSFAWQHEFCAFNKLAKEDSLGRDIRLSNGNVSSRILPIKIHDLDAEDKTLLENELGGVLRAIEFIYKSGGVNRPMNSKDDEVRTTYKILYRDQVNKVANAVKEIITSLKNPVSPNTQSAKGQQPIANRSPTRQLSEKTIALATVAIMVLMALIYTASQFTGSPIKEPEIIDKSIAVLPFVNMSNDPEQEYFSDGIAEEVINVLASQVRDLRVIGRTSSFQFKGKNLDLRKIGDSLGVAYVLEGSVRKSKDQLRITAQLIKTSDGSHIWSKTFTRRADEDFDVQDEIAKTVSTSLQASMLREGVNGESVANARNPEAYELYLQGRFFFNQRGTGLSKGLELFKQAIVLDSSFASAYAGMSGCYALLTFYKFMPSLTGIKETKKWAYKAIALDPNSSEGYLFLAYAAYFLEYDWTSAEQLFQRSIELSPNVAFPRALYASYLLMVEGDAIGSEKQARKASELDPLFFLPYNALGLALMTQRKYDPGLEALQKAIDLNAKPDVVYTSLASALLQQNRSNEAVKIIEENMSVTGRTQSMLIGLISALAKSGKMDQAMEVYGEIQEMNRRENAEPYTLGVAATTVGRMDEAFRYFNLALEQKNSGFIGWSPYNYYHPDWFLALEKDPRYKKIMDRLAFPEK